MARPLALVGVGKIARDQHIPAIAATDGFALAATASRNASVEGVPAFRDLATLLGAHPEIGCVSLCTPPGARYDDARRALLAGRHVMLEKPPGATLSEVEALADLARAQGVTLYASWHSRAASAVGTARDWLAARRVTGFAISWREDVRQWHPGQDWIWEPGGLGVFDPGINALSILTAILPCPVHLARAELRFPSNRDTPIAADLVFAGGDGLSGTADFDWGATGEPDWTIEVETEDGTAVLSRGGATLRLPGQDPVAGEDREYETLYRRFDALIAAGESEVDLAPLRLVADAFLLGRRRDTDPFHW